MQDWQSGKSETMIAENAAFYESGQAKWLIVSDTVEIDEISNAINANYTLYKEVSYTSYGTEHFLLLYYRNE